MMLPSEPAERADMLRRLADEIDPPVPADPDPFNVSVKLYRDGIVVEARTIELPLVGDGVFNGFLHEGKRVHVNGVPDHYEQYQLSVMRVRA